MPPTHPMQDPVDPGASIPPVGNRSASVRAVLLIGALAVVALLGLAAGVVKWNSSSPAADAASESDGVPQQIDVPQLELPPGDITDTIPAMPDRPEIAWRATPEALELGDDLQFHLGRSGEADGVMMIGDLAVVRYMSVSSPEAPDVVALFSDPDLKAPVAGLVALDRRTGAVRWSREVDSAYGCLHVEGTTSAVCSGLRTPPGQDPAEGLALYEVIDLTSGTTTGTTLLPLHLRVIREVQGRVINIGHFDDDSTRIASGTLEEPQADWVTRIPDRPEKPSQTGSLDRIGADPTPASSAEAAPGTADCYPYRSVDTEIVGTLATISDAESPLLDLTTGALVDVPDAVKMEIMPGGTVVAAQVCPPGVEEVESSTDLEWTYYRMDGVPLPEIEGDPVRGYDNSMRWIVAGLPAADLPVLTSAGAYSHNGEFLWNWPADARPYGNERVAVVGDTIVAAGVIHYTKGLMRGYDLATGHEKWHADPPIAGDGRSSHFVATDADRVFTTTGAAISIPSGQIEWDLGEFPEPPPLPGAFAKFGASSTYTQWVDDTIIHSNEREIIAYR